MFSVTRSLTCFNKQTTNLLRLSIRSISTTNKLNPDSLVSKYSPGPISVRYTTEHEWIAQHPDGVSFVGITKYASDALGDATYVELPEVDESYEEGDSIGSVESVKSSSEIFAPVKILKILSINENLNDKPQLINEDPLGDGYLAKLELEKKLEEYEGLLNEEEYIESLQAEAEEH